MNALKGAFETKRVVDRKMGNYRAVDRNLFKASLFM